MKKLKDLSPSKKRIAIIQAINTIKRKLRKLEAGSQEYIFCQELLNKYQNVNRFYGNKSLW